MAGVKGAQGMPASVGRGACREFEDNHPQGGQRGTRNMIRHYEAHRFLVEVLKGIVQNDFGL